MLYDRRVNGIRMIRLILGVGMALGTFGLITRDPWLWSAWPIAGIAVAWMNQAILRRQGQCPWTPYE